VGEPFAHSLRVRYAECDVLGIVFNSRYLEYFDVTLTELWRAAIGGYQVMLDRGLDVVVVEAQIRFLDSARFDQELSLEMEFAHLGNTSIVSRHRIGHDGRALVEGTMVHVTVDRRTASKTPIPDWLRAALSRWHVPDG